MKGIKTGNKMFFDHIIQSYNRPLIKQCNVSLNNNIRGDQRAIVPLFKNPEYTTRKFMEQNEEMEK